MAGPQVGVGNSNYTPIVGVATATINPGQSGPKATSQGVLYGASCVQFGTAPVISIFDVIPPSNIGTNTTTTTNLLLSGTFTAAGQVLPSNSAGLGVRYQGALVAMTAGTLSILNVLWD